MENLDYVACVVIFLGWIFIGAAVFGDGNDYIKELREWFLITVIIIGVVLAAGAIIWAFTRLAGIGYN